MHISTFRVAAVTVACAASVVGAAALAGGANGSSDHAAAPLSASAPMVTPRVVSPRNDITVSGQGCATSQEWTTGVDVTLSRGDQDVATAAADHDQITDGAWSVVLHVPRSAKPGTYKVLSTCDQYEYTFSYPEVAVTVTAAAKRTTLTISAPHGRTQFGSSATVFGQVLVGKQPVSGVPVTLLARAHGTHAFTVVATRKTDARGRVSAAVAPQTTTLYRWSFAGSATMTPSASANRPVVVARQVTAGAARSKVSVGASVSVSGTVTPGRRGLRVILQRLAKGNWSTVAGATVTRQKGSRASGKSAYVVSMVAKQATTYVLRVMSVTSDGFSDSVSPTFRVTARR